MARYINSYPSRLKLAPPALHGVHIAHTTALDGHTFGS